MNLSFSLNGGTTSNINAKKNVPVQKPFLLFIDLIHMKSTHQWIGKEQKDNERKMESDINQHRLKCNF